ncbi:sugar ABC transporter permease [Faecalicatena sp. AGMB00832]|uniref:Sugar ABC transporter permease n=1 Tax=Faecalicatena faecalis TaxID=2726362 RepID=A0ABS6CYV5_9FIRM|nr:sugar ABC transporter permease [Faecalicatena faecalis]MBU3874504.1 sugar ABC transporter permease [Faecalicatena faecalis]
MNRNKKNVLKGLLFIAPNYIGFFIFTLVPMVTAIVISFTKWKMGDMEFIGLKNYLELLSSRSFYKSFLNTVLFVLGTVPVTIVLGLGIAYFVDRYAYGKSLIRTIMFLPYTANIVAICYVWMMLFQPTYGPVNQLILKFVKTAPGWLTSSEWALICIMALQVWMYAGYCMVIYLAALKQVPSDLMEAAAIDGASRYKQFVHIILPSLSPTTFFILITMLINSLKIFAPMNIMTDGGPGDSTSVLVFQSYITAFRYNDMGTASAISTILFLIILGITLYQWKGQNKWVNY